MKKWPVALVGLMLCLLLASCVGAGLGDWSYPLPNSYAVWRVNSQCIVFGKEADHTLSFSVDSYIFAFCFNDRYVGLKRLEEKPLPDVTVPADAFEYYLADTQTEQTIGPMTEGEYLDILTSLDLRDLCAWIETCPTPSGAVY